MNKQEQRRPSAEELERGYRKSKGPCGAQPLPDRLAAGACQDHPRGGRGHRLQQEVGARALPPLPQVRARGVRGPQAPNPRRREEGAARPRAARGAPGSAEGAARVRGGVWSSWKVAEWIEEKTGRRGVRAQRGCGSTCAGSGTPHRSRGPRTPRPTRRSKRPSKKATRACRAAEARTPGCAARGEVRAEDERGAWGSKAGPEEGLLSGLPWAGGRRPRGAQALRVGLLRLRLLVRPKTGEVFWLH